MAIKRELKLTDTRIKQLVPPDAGRDTYHDSEQRALKLLIGFTGVKSFYLRTNFNNKTIFRKLGRFPDISTTQARKKVNKYMESINNGIDPKISERAKQAKNTTVRQCLDDYIETRTSLNKTTETSYKRYLKKYIPDWFDKPLLEITRDKVERRHKRIGAISHSSANKVMRILRALFEYAHGKYENEKGEPIILHNPVKRLNHTKSWFPETRRKTYIKPSNIRPWYEAVTSAPDWLNSDDPELIRDYLLLILFTGLRRNEASGLRWDWIDLDHRIMTIPKTKNKDSHTLPLSNFLFELLKSRHSDNNYTNNNGTKSEYVFPGSGTTGHLVEPKKSIAKIRTRCKRLVLSYPFSNINEVNITPHDLRRTFITVAESLGIRDYVLKRLLNHRNHRDVTDQYIITDVDRLRAPMQQITDHILMLSKLQDNILPFAIKQKNNT